MTSRLYRFSTEIQYSYVSSGASGAIRSSCRGSLFKVRNGGRGQGHLPVPSLSLPVHKISHFPHLLKTPMDFQGFLFDKNLRSSVVRGCSSGGGPRFWAAYSVSNFQLRSYSTGKEWNGEEIIVAQDIILLCHITTHQPRIIRNPEAIEA